MKWKEVTKTLVLEYIERNQKISIELLAQEIGVSTSYLYRNIRKETGLSTSRFIEIIRLELACTKLKDTSSHISTIGKEIGFSESTYFIKKFKKQYGLTPLQYRKRYKKEVL